METIVAIIAVIFDLDGLLLITEGIYDQMFKDYGWLRTGKNLPKNEFETMRAKQFGGTQEQSAKIMLEAYGVEPTDEEVKKFLEWRKNEYGLEDKFKNTAAFQGAKELVLKLKSNSIPIALATSSSRKLLKSKAIQNPWLLEAFGNNIITGDDVKNSKPHPESFQKAAELIGIQKEDYNRTLVLEDAPNGIQAAKAAGMKVVAIPDPRLPEPEKNLAGADQVLHSLTDFQPEQWGIILS